MFDVGDKPDTLRIATARAIVKVSAETVSLIMEGKSPKGDIVDAARISATMGAKRTWDLLPYCHPIPIDHVKVDVSIKTESIEVDVQVKTTWKTGVEMESLTGASIAALTIYDMLKPVDETLAIESIKLLSKSGGLKDFYEKYDKPLSAVVIVISDSVSKGERSDKSGKLAVERLKESGFEVVDYRVIPDDPSQIESSLVRGCDELKADLVLTSGGTGLGPRDTTPESTRKVLENEIIGISEALRMHGQRRTPLSMLSRGAAGVRGKSVVVNLPGSAKAVSESLDALLPGILHASKMLGGHGH
ncbi:MAG: bifunctional molybdenum cofactor biosynthesis protein MoaC/MoaB [Thaumarchaeota archaeon]|nr:MAG: bifunctional molybdenum cofactor biosynthesis protein MoaC/MoaB [Thaumarchaeota archaeon 13_1_40CM_4_48_7]TLY10018.1 MAG: bifunctional molybdenum cofactor biosynthesis protein MoaC/MoaB [Nitrososphaerota archaeon]